MVGRIGEKPGEIIYLPTKINKPSLAQKVIVRKELIEKFDKGLSETLTTVVSPAGFGKTTAVLSWTDAHDDLPVAWYLLDEEDKALDRFWKYFTASMRIADKAICHSLDEVSLSDDFPAMRSVLDLLLLELAEYDEDFIFVLEDFHTVHESPAIHESMTYFLKHLPSNVHGVITSRHTLRLSLAKMKVEGLLNEIIEADLRFSEKELLSFFQELGINIGEEKCHSVYESTQGWPTGSKLIALLCGSGTEQEIDDAILLSKNSINDYLFEEVFAELDESLQRFLLATSTVDSFSLSLAEKITGLSQDEAVDIIDSLFANDLFIEKIERKGGEDWYRYHLLFSEMLHQRLERFDREKVNEMRIAARDWFDARGYLDYVVEVSADLHDYGKIKQVIIENWKTLYISDSHFTLLRWAAEIPSEEILNRPMLCAILTMPYAIMGDFEKANSLIDHALSRLHNEADFLYAFCMAQKAYIFNFINDIESMSVYVEKALEYLPENEYYLRGMMLQVQAYSWIDTDPLRSEQAFSQVLDTLVAFGNRGLSSALYCTLASVCANLGHLEESNYYCDLAFDLYDEQERKFKPMLSSAYLSQMMICYQKRDFEGVLDAFSFFKSTSEGGAILSNVAEALAILAKTEFAMKEDGRDDFFKAMSINEDGALRGLPCLGMARTYYEAFKTISQEKVDACSRKHQVQFFSFEVSYHISPKERYEELCGFTQSINPEERILKLSSLVLCAAYSEKCGFMKRADSYLLEAFSFAKKVDLYQPIYENLSELEPILQRTSSQVSDTADLVLINEILDRVNNANPVADLTEREIDVMRLMALGLTMQDAAEKLYVSRDTVKKHLGNVYTKLGVHSKLDAVTVLRDSKVI